MPTAVFQEETSKEAKEYLYSLQTKRKKWKVKRRRRRRRKVTVGGEFLSEKKRKKKRRKRKRKKKRTTAREGSGKRGFFPYSVRSQRQIFFARSQGIKLSPLWMDWRFLLVWPMAIHFHSLPPSNY